MYGYSNKINLSFEKTIEAVRESLQREGFGILTEIDVKSTLKKKLDVDIDNYVILGACNPPNAYNAIQTEQEIGLLLPCNVIVYSKNNETFVSSILPTKAMSIIDNPELSLIAKQIEKKLKTAIGGI